MTRRLGPVPGRGDANSPALAGRILVLRKGERGAPCVRPVIDGSVESPGLSEHRPSRVHGAHRGSFRRRSRLIGGTRRRMSEAARTERRSSLQAGSGRARWEVEADPAADAPLAVTRKPTPAGRGPRQGPLFDLAMSVTGSARARRAAATAPEPGIGVGYVGRRAALPDNPERGVEFAGAYPAASLRPPIRRR